MVGAPGAVVPQATATPAHQDLVIAAALHPLPVARVLPGAGVCRAHGLGLVVTLTALDPASSSVKAHNGVKVNKLTLVMSDLL